MQVGEEEETEVGEVGGWIFLQSIHDVYKILKKQLNLDNGDIK